MIKCFNCKRKNKQMDQEIDSSKNTSCSWKNVHVIDAISTRSKTSSSYSNYKSDYEIDMNPDVSYKNKLVQKENEDNDLFALKNDFFVNYGNELYTLALEKFHDRLNTIDYFQFNESIWNKCRELHESSLNEKNTLCFGFIKMQTLNDDFDNIHKLYSFLNKMHIKNIKMKTWIETRNIILGFSEE